MDSCVVFIADLLQVTAHRGAMDDLEL